MLILTRLCGFMQMRKPFEATLTNAAGQTAPGSSFTFTNRSFGNEPVAGQRRYIAVAVAGAQNENRSITAVTIGGIAATNIVQRTNTHIPCGVWVAEVPTGTSGNVDLTFNNDLATVGIAVVRLINPGNHLGFDTASAAHASGTINLSVDIPSSGFAVAVAHAENGSTTTWTGLTEQIDTDLNSGEFFTAASGGVAGTPVTITADNADDTPSSFEGVCVSWGP